MKYEIVCYGYGKIISDDRSVSSFVDIKYSCISWSSIYIEKTRKTVMFHFVY